MNINVEIDTHQLTQLLDLGSKRLAYGVVNAINETAKHVQRAERARVSAEFTVRKPVCLTCNRTQGWARWWANAWVLERRPHAGTGDLEI